MEFERVPTEVREVENVISASALAELFRSPKHFYSSYILKERPVTKAMEEGSMIHKAILEPDKFEESYVIADDKALYLDTADDLKNEIIKLGGKPRGKKGDLINQLLSMDTNAKIWAVYLDELAEQKKQIVSAEDWAKCQRLIAEVKGHKWLSKALNGGMVEQSAWWKHEMGVIISMRMDFYHPAMGINKKPVIIDLKTSRSADPKTFNKTIWNNGLFIQAAVYVDGVKAITGVEPLYCWAVVEKEPPYAIEVVAADFGLIEAGRSVYKKMIVKYLECKQSGIWPGYTDGSVTNISLPSWAFDSLNYDLEDEIGQE